MICDGYNNDKYIQIYENALPNNICEEIIKLFEDNFHEHNDGITGGGLNKSIKVTREMRFNEGPLNKFDNLLFTNLNKYLNTYINMLDIRFNEIHDSGYQIQKYIKKEGFYKLHHDSRASIRNNKISNRIITYLWYLNDVEEGGETLFSTFKIKPKMGSLLLFPSTWTYIHGGEMPISNDKYIITGWVWDNFK